MSRRPKPIEVKKKQGNPGRRPLAKGTPQFETGTSVPKWVKRYARTEWRRIEPQLKMNKMLTKVNRSGLTGYCLSFAIARRAHEALEGENDLTIETGTGSRKPRPEVAILFQALDQCRKFMIEFGMTPASRSRITLTDLGKGSPTSDFLFGDEGEESGGGESNVTEFPKGG